MIDDDSSGQPLPGTHCCMYNSISARKCKNNVQSIHLRAQPLELDMSSDGIGGEIGNEHPSGSDNIGAVSVAEEAESGTALRDTYGKEHLTTHCETFDEIEGARLSRFLPTALELPTRPTPANEINYTHYFAVDVGKKLSGNGDNVGQDQYIYRHANGLCIIGLAPTHSALFPKPCVTAVDFNVGKQSRADMKAFGKKKKGARVLEENSVLCKVITGNEETFFLIRCCVRGVLLEVNEQLCKDPQSLNLRPASEGYIAILMPRPEDWFKAAKLLLTREQYRAHRGLS